MSFVESVKSCISNFITFSGRAERSEFWWFVIFYLMGILLMGVADVLVFIPDYATGRAPAHLSTLFGALAFLPLIAVACRRMHDSNSSGWFAFMPMALSFFVVLTTVLEIPPIPELSDFRQSALWPNASTMALLLFVSVTLTMVFLYLTTRPSDIGPNEYGHPAPIQRRMALN